MAPPMVVSSFDFQRCCLSGRYFSDKLRLEQPTCQQRVTPELRDLDVFSFGSYLNQMDRLEICLQLQSVSKRIMDNRKSAWVKGNRQRPCSRCPPNFLTFALLW
jgi:hypothetical protein